MKLMFVAAVSILFGAALGAMGMFLLIKETKLDMNIDLLDDIRKGITFDGIIPEDAINRITAYKNVYETANSGNLEQKYWITD